MQNDLPKIEPEKRQVFNGVEVSYGISPILSTLSDLSTRPGRQTWNLYLINVETLIRDRKERDASLKAMAQGVITDCTVLAQYISAYNRYTAANDKGPNPVVCFYLSHYEDIPRIYLRNKLPKGTEERWRVRNIIEGILKTDGFPERFEDTDIRFAVPEYRDGRRWPHRELLTDLSHTFDGIRYRKTLMVSHVPLDFHLYRVFSEFSILESYTGAIKQVKQFGKKVFGDNDIPFNKYTHLLLGDRWYLEPQIKGTARRKLKEIAQKEHWALLPEKAVAEAIIQSKMVLPDLIMKPDI